MKVILTDEIRGLGTRGDVVTVKDGYARNFLLPKKLAREATPGNLKSVEQERKKWALLAQQEKDAAQKAADSVKGDEDHRSSKRVGDHGQLFGSVTANEIADALTAKGIEVDKRRIELAHPIKSSACTTSKSACTATSPRTSRSKSSPRGRNRSSRKRRCSCGGCRAAEAEAEA